MRTHLPLHVPGAFRPCIGIKKRLRLRSDGGGAQDAILLSPTLWYTAR